MEKIKQFFNKTIQGEKGKDILVIIIVILVGLGSFELGRLSRENDSSGIKIEYEDQSASVIPSLAPISDNIGNSQTISNSGKTFFASSRGTKYYTISCSAGKTIKQENRVYFATGEEAQRAGYTLSSSCQ